ncbi:unnamed protein product, partial [Mesorhabditis belari]|uniref:Uncharacterized protein n=1 Tax=Mesorhabditis belari TaxID=2138241 RepID=A0AAF3J262_9BILA
MYLLKDTRSLDFLSTNSLQTNSLLPPECSSDSISVKSSIASPAKRKNSAHSFNFRFWRQRDKEFTAGVGRPGLAREAREAVQKVISTANPIRKPPISAPIDYEKFVREKSIFLENDPQRELVLFPRDDIEQTTREVIPKTDVPSAVESDIERARWLLTKEALRIYSAPYNVLRLNYSRFSGDYDLISDSSIIDGDMALSSLVFESDLAASETRATREGFSLTDTIKEGWLLIVKTDPTLLDNLKAEKKRFCSLKKLKDGEIVFEISKGPSLTPTTPAIRVNAAQVKRSKKDKVVLEIQKCLEEDGNEKDRSMCFTTADSDGGSVLEEWHTAVNLAVSLKDKDVGKSQPSLSENDGKSGKHDASLDSESIHSEDSGGSQNRDGGYWRGRTTTIRALQPPIVERRNLFALYSNLTPLIEPKGETSTLMAPRRWSSNFSNEPITPDEPPISTPTKSSVIFGVKVNFNQERQLSFLIHLKNFDLRLPISPTQMEQIEPFFLRLFLFDVVTGKRASEEFHVDLNSNDLSTLWKINRERRPSGSKRLVNSIPNELITNGMAKQIISSLPSQNKNIWIIVRIDRILSPDVQGELYMKTADPKAVLKLQKTVSAACSRLGTFRARFAWAARPLYLDTSIGATQFETIPIFRCEGNKLPEIDLQKHLQEYSKLEKINKLTIPGASITISVEFSPKVETLPFRVSPSLLPLRPWKSPKDSPSLPVFYLQSFGNQTVEPYSDLVNLLYVYPLRLKYDNQKVFGKARNIVCSVKYMRAGQVMDGAIIDRLSVNGPFLSQGHCCVQHHQQYPTFCEEIKMRLPLSLESCDHLLFSFSHISVAGVTNAKSPSESLESPVGYAWLPLLTKKDRLTLESEEQEFNLPVAVDLPSNYYNYFPSTAVKEEGLDIKWVDAKPLFNIRLRLISSAFTTEPKLHTFFQACEKFNKFSSDEMSTSTTKSTDSPRSCSPLARAPDNDRQINRELETRLQNLCEIDTAQLLPYLPVLLRRLLYLLPFSSTNSLAISTLSSLVAICERLVASGHRRFLRKFLRIHCDELDKGEESIHNAIVKYLPAFLQSVGSIEELASVFRQMWFLLDVISKTMAQFIMRMGHFKNPRNERVPGELIDQITAFVETLIPLMIAKHKEFPDESRLANTALANFYKCCLSLIDRGAVFRWMHFTVLKLDESDLRIMREFKLDLLTIVCQHEHFLPLSLPTLMDRKNTIQRINYQSNAQDATTVNAGNTAGFLSRFITQLFQTPSIGEQNEMDRYALCLEEFWLSEGYCNRHFPIGILFQELYECLRESRDYRRKPISLVRNLLAKHSIDNRYAETNIQRRIAVLYTPILRFAIDHLTDLETVVERTHDEGWFASAKWRSLDRRSVVTIETLRANGPYLPTSARENAPQIAPLTEKLDVEEVKDLLVSVLWVIHRLPVRILGLLWSEYEENDSMKFLRLLELTLEVFSYKTRNQPLSTNSYKNRNTMRPTSLSSFGNFQTFDGFEDFDTKNTLPFGALQILNLSQEVAMIVLDTMDTVLRELAGKWHGANTTWEKRFRYLLTIHLNLLDLHWPETVRLNTLASLGAFINLFRPRLFETGSLDALSLLIEKLLLQMASRLSSIQTSAAALLQFVLRAGYETAQAALANEALSHSVAPLSKVNGIAKREIQAAERLGRPGSQAGVALARLLGSQQGLSGCLGRFERGLGCLESLIPRDDKKSGPFESAVKELVKQLRGVLEATSALIPAKNDPVKLADLHIQLADSYRGSAAYRSLWFDALAEVHSTGDWHSEAAVAYAHSVAIIAKELATKGVILNLDWSVLDWVSSTIASEEGVRGSSFEVVQPAEFTLENLTSKIDKCCRELTLAERFEAIGPIYRLLIPTLERNKNYNLLRSVYAELNQSSSRALEASTSGRRHLGSYFKVAFLGLSHFGKDLHQSEWIYREAGLTSLAAASCSLQEYCRQLVGHDRIKIEPEKECDLSTLDATFAYVYITHVEPMYDDEKDKLNFDVHTNCRTFVYESPIVEDGDWDQKSEPPLQKQGLRKTIITVIGSFPSNRRRLPIDKSKRQFVTLTPLEFASQKLKTKARQIARILDLAEEGRQLDIKGLQLLLQGAVMPTVNAGPLAYAEAFSQPDQQERYGKEKMEELCDAFRELMKACERGLTANGSAVGPDQQKYHEVLVSSAEAMVERLTGYFGESFRRPLEEKPDFPRSTIHILDTISGVNA